MIANDSSSVRFYNLTAGQSFPNWVTPDQRRKLKKDKAYQSRVMVLQDFTMPAASQRMKVSRDQRSLFVSGTYKPLVKCYDVDELSVKFERCLDEEIVDFELLNDDFSKVCFLGSGTLFFHAKYGHYHKTKLFTIGRSLQYDRATCDMYIAGSSPELLRLNLEAGRFLQPIPTDFSSGMNVVKINPVHSLVAVAGSDSFFECRDPRAPQKQPLARINVGAQLMEAGEISSAGECEEVTSLEFDTDGLHMGIGTGSGHALLYDLRAPNPVFIKDHRNEKKVHTVRFHESKMYSVDQKVIKIWDERTGDSFANLETCSPSNDMVIWPDSGLMFLAAETPQTMAYYCPTIGKAPRWCSFLDNVTEELEEERNAHKDEIFDNFKFVTIDELKSIGGNSLIGTRYVRQYMHGFFMSSKLYKQMRATANPELYDEMEKQKIQKKVEQMRESRISAVAVPEKKKKTASSNEDSRFKAVKSNPNFAIEDKFVEIEEKKKAKKRERDKVRMFEVRGDLELEDAHDADQGSGVMFSKEKKSKSKKPLGERAAALETEQGGRERARTNISSAETKFLSKETRDKLASKKKEKMDRIEHNKTRRKAAGNLNKR
jgi:ribosome biogenesis protein ENP2